MADEVVGRDIPDEIKREVRQRCGFGCVICGKPLYQYEHMPGFANVLRHRAEEITLLCPDHHAEKTNKLLPVEVVERANADPYNKRAGVSPAYFLNFSGTRCEVKIGDNRFIAEDEGHGGWCIPLIIDNIPLIMFRLEDGHLLFSLRVFNDKDELILDISDNYVKYSVTPWDIQLVGRRLTIKASARNILLDMELYTPNIVHVRSGRFCLGGFELLVRPEYSVFVNTGSLMAGCTVINGNGIAIGPEPRVGCNFYFPASDGLRHMGNYKEAMRTAREAMKRYRTEQVEMSLDSLPDDLPEIVRQRILEMRRRVAE